MAALSEGVEGQIGLRPGHTSNASDPVSWTDEIVTWDRDCAWWSWEDSMLVCCFHNSQDPPLPLFLSLLLSSILLQHQLKASWSQEKVTWRSQQWNLQYSLRLPNAMPRGFRPGWRDTQLQTKRAVVPLATQRFGKEMEGMLAQNIVSDAFISSWNYK